MRRFFLLPLVVLCACHEGESDVQTEGTACDDDGDCVAAFAEVGACEKPVCSQEGQCILGQLPDGTACRDGLACTAPDYCLQGQCTGATVRCVDNNPCTLDSCDDETGCVFTPSSGEACDDLNDCTVGD